MFFKRVKKQIIVYIWILLVRKKKEIIYQMTGQLIFPCLSSTDKLINLSIHLNVQTKRRNAVMVFNSHFDDASFTSFPYPLSTLAT